MIAARTETPQLFPAPPALPPPPADPLPGTHVYLLKNSRLGLFPKVPIWEPGFLIRNHQNALGLRAELRQTRVGSRCSGKERDQETGLDYFGARYLSSAQGRWTSPDWSPAPEPVPYADLSDPQTLNLYGYVRNNPLGRADADGHCGLIGGGPCSLKQFIASVPDRVVGALKMEANIVLDNTRLGNVITGRFTPSNAEQADAMANRSVVEQPMMTGLAMAIPGPKGAKGEALPSEANVVRGGLSTTETLTKAVGTHPEGVTGVSVESAAGKSVQQLAKESPTVSGYGQVRCCTVGDVRAAGGDVVPTSGASPNHATMTGLTPKQMNEVLKPPIPNPAKNQ